LPLSPPPPSLVFPNPTHTLTYSPSQLVHFAIPSQRRGFCLFLYPPPSFQKKLADAPCSEASVKLSRLSTEVAPCVVRLLRCPFGTPSLFLCNFFSALAVFSINKARLSSASFSEKFAPPPQHSTASFDYLCAFLMFSFLHLLTLSPSLCIRNAGFRGFCNTFSLSHTCGQHFSRACFQPGLETDLHPPPLSACFFKCPTLSFFTSAFAHELSSDYCSIPSVLFRLLFHSLRPAVAKFCSCSPHFRFIFDGIS